MVVICMDPGHAKTEMGAKALLEGKVRGLYGLGEGANGGVGLGNWQSCRSGIGLEYGEFCYLIRLL